MGSLRPIGPLTFCSAQQVAVGVDSGRRHHGHPRGKNLHKEFGLVIRVRDIHFRVESE